MSKNLTGAAFAVLLSAGAAFAGGNVEPNLPVEVIVEDTVTIDDGIIVPLLGLAMIIGAFIAN